MHSTKMLNVKNGQRTDYFFNKFNDTQTVVFLIRGDYKTVLEISYSARHELCQRIDSSLLCTRMNAKRKLKKQMTRAMHDTCDVMVTASNTVTVPTVRYFMK